MTAAVSAQDQLERKPEIDDVLCHTLDSDTLKEALFVIDNIRENKMKIKWNSVNEWSVHYKGKFVCNLRIDYGCLTIGQISEVLAERVKNMSYNHEGNNPPIRALIDLVTGERQASYAMS